MPISNNVESPCNKRKCANTATCCGCPEYFEWEKAQKEKASVQIGDADPVVALKAAIVATDTQDEYSSGFRNALRYAVSVLTNEKPEYEKGYSSDDKISKAELIDYIRWLLHEIEKEDRTTYPKWMHKQPLLSVVGYITTHGETLQAARSD